MDGKLWAMYALKPIHMSRNMDIIIIHALLHLFTMVYVSSRTAVRQNRENVTMFIHSGQPRLNNTGSIT